MIGDVIHIRPEYFEISNQLEPLLFQKTEISGNDRNVVLIGGESGSGKSVTALCLSQTLENKGQKSVVLHLDDYFKLPPKTNHEARLQSLTNVGAHEVNMELLQAHVDAFLNGDAHLQKPLVDYHANSIGSETISLEDASFLIIEGTYALLLENACFHVFMARNYHDTHAQRMARGREAADDFVESVLEIEHQIVSAMRAKADVVIEKDYTVSAVEN